MFLYKEIVELLSRQSFSPSLYDKSKMIIVKILLFKTDKTLHTILLGIITSHKQVGRFCTQYLSSYQALKIFSKEFTPTDNDDDDS